MKKLIIILIFFNFSSFAQEKKLTLLLDWFINPDHGPIIIAEKKGYFEDLNLKVEIIAPADPSAPPRLVAAGKGDLAISYQPQLHLQVNEGLPLIRVGTLVSTPLNCLLVLKDGPINSPKDLKGKKIGFSVAGVEEALLSSIFDKYGFNVSDITLVNVNFALSPSLMSGQVDAVIGAFRNFELNQMDINNVPGKCFYLEEEGIPSYDELIYVANNKLDKKEEIKLFLNAVEKGTQFIINHPNESWKIFSSYSKELDDELNSRAWKDTLPRFALRPFAVDYIRYERFEKFLFDANLIKQKNNINELIIDISK